MGKPNVNVVIGGNRRSTNTGKTIVLKNNLGLAEQLTEENAKYVIKWDFDIDSTVEIPEGCVLEFEGGSINGTGTLKGDFTQIDADKVPIFSGIKISGTWDVPEITSAWFEDAAEMNRIKQLINLTHADVYNTVTIEAGDYLVRPFGDTSKEDADDARDDAVAYPEFYPKYNATGGQDYSDTQRRGLMLKSNTKIVLLGNMVMMPTKLTSYASISIGNYGSNAFVGENVTITGTGSMIGEAQSRPDITHYSKGMAIICRSNARNLLVEGITITDYIGTCIASSNSARNTVVRNVTMKDSLWYGVTFTHSYSCKVENCVFQNLVRAGGIDIEPQDTDEVDGILIKGCEFDTVHKAVSMTNITGSFTKNITIEDCYIHDIVARYSSDFGPSYGIKNEGALSNIKISHCNIDSGEFEAIHVACIDVVGENVYDKKDLCDNLVIEGCVISSTAKDAITTFFPNVSITGCTISMGGCYINRDFTGSYPSGADQSLKSAADFIATLSDCDVTFTERIVTDGGKRIFDNCKVNFLCTTDNQLVRRTDFLNCLITIGGTKHIRLTSNCTVDNCSIQVADGFSDSYLFDLNSNTVLSNSTVRTSSYSTDTPNMDYLVYIGGSSRTNIKVVGNVFDINSKDGSIKAIGCHINNSNIVIDDNMMIELREGYKIPNDPFNSNGSSNTSAPSKAAGFRNNILPYGTTEYRNGVGPEVLNCLNGAPFYDETVKKMVYYNRSERAWVTEEGFSVLATKGTTAQRPTIPYTEREGTDLPTDGSKIYVGYTFHLTTNDSYQIASAINSSNIITWTAENVYADRYVPSDVRRSGTTAQRPDDAYVFNNLYVGFEYFDTTEQRYCYVKSMNRSGDAGDYVYYVVWEYRPLNEGLVSPRDIGYKYFDTTLGKLITWNGNTWVTEDGFSAVPTKGTSAQRPELSLESDTGFRYFDTILNRSIYYKLTEVLMQSWTLTGRGKPGYVADNYFENPFEQGKSYKVTIPANIDSLKLYFCTSNDGTGTRYEVIKSGRQFLFTAPSESEYLYIDLYITRSIDSTFTAYELTGTWLEYDGSPVQE